ncbi:MAG: DUF11 domain-containing protein [Kiritimatiellae bacterium]|nr:DUF11 domain-containing protein [Kiritimatiellia bacterium]
MGVTFVDSSDTNYSDTTGLWTIGNLSSGAVDTLSITATVSSAGCNAIINMASLSSLDQTDTNSLNDNASAIIMPQCADIHLLKLVDNHFPSINDTIVYLVSARNFGIVPATSVVVTDSLPAGVTFVGSSDTNYSDMIGLWSIGILAVGVATLSITATVTSTGCAAITNTASLSSLDQTDTNSVNNNTSAMITPQCVDIALTKTADNPLPSINDTIVYTVIATNLVVTDSVPVGVSFVGSSDTNYNDTSGLWSIGSLTNGGISMLSITATVTSAGCTAITNTTSLISVGQTETNSANDSAIAVITPQCVDVGLSKSVDNAGPLEGDTIIYTVTVTNWGPNDATTLVVTDVLPSGVSFVSSSETNYAPPTWTIGTLSNGSSISLLVTATVDAATSGISITNVAGVFALDQTDTTWLTMWILQPLCFP